MKSNFRENAGLNQLYHSYRKAFRIPENLNYYSAEDFRIAERKFIKHGLMNGNIELFTPDHPKPT